MKVGWICLKCGNKYGKPLEHAATFHKGECSVCGDNTSVTQGRDFGISNLELNGDHLHLINKLSAAWGDIPLDEPAVQNIMNNVFGICVDAVIDELPDGSTYVDQHQRNKIKGKLYRMFIHH